MDYLHSADRHATEQTRNMSNCCCLLSMLDSLIVEGGGGGNTLPSGI
jgi:hypothetical protein